MLGAVTSQLLVSKTFGIRNVNTQFAVAELGVDHLSPILYPSRRQQSTEYDLLPALVHLLPDIFVVDITQFDHGLIIQRREFAGFGVVGRLLDVLGARDGG